MTHARIPTIANPIAATKNLIEISVLNIFASGLMINADKKLPTLYVAEIIAIASDACAAGTMFAPNVTAPGFLIANPIPTRNAPTQITAKFVDKATQAVPAAITKIDPPIVNLLNVLTTVPRRSPPMIPDT